MKMEYENWTARIFPGFYESIFDLREQLYCQSQTEAEDGYELEIKDFNQYQKDVCECWVDCLKDSLYDNSIDLEVGKFKELWSPREYNFYTDKITVNVKFNLNKLKQYCWKTRLEAFKEYLYKNWSSRDGFWSFIPNNLEGFKYNYNSPKKYDLIAVMFEFYLLQEVDFEQVNIDTYYASQECLLLGNLCLADEKTWKKCEMYWDNEVEKYRPIKEVA